MVKVQYGIAITELRGSIGGATFSANHAGAYAKAKRTPRNKNTALQNIRRPIFGNLVYRFANTLTPLQRTGWATYAADTPLLDAFGNTYHMSALNAYIKTNTSAFLCERQYIDGAPPTGGLGPNISITEGEITVDVSADSISFTEAAFPDWGKATTDATILIFQGPTIRGSKVFFESPHKFLGYITGDAIAPPAVPQAFTPVYAITAGHFTPLKFRRLNPVGKLGANTYKKKVIVA